MPTVVKAYLGTTPLFTGSTGGSSAGWERPSDWLVLPVAAPHSVNMLNAVFDQTENYVMLRMITSAGGTYQVDWGDGFVEIVNSNVNAFHNYSFSTPALDGTLCSRGYKQAIIKVTVLNGGICSFFTVQLKTSTPAGLQAYTSGILDMNINLPSLIAGLRLQIGGSAIRHGLLERVNITSWGALSLLDNLFQNCPRLQSINEIEWNLSPVASLSGTFRGCGALTRLDCSNWNISGVNNWSNAFLSCTGLTSFKAPSGTIAASTNFVSVFQSCSALESLDLSGWNVTAVRDMTSLFNGCTSLRNLNLTGWNVSGATNATNMFLNCTNLQQIPALNLTGVTTLTSGGFCAGSNSLTRIQASNIRQTVNISSCMLGATALNEIFANLASGAVRTITITGNYGADTAISKTTCGTTAGSRTVTQSNTSSLQVGMQVSGTGVTTAVAVTFQDAEDTVTRTAHGLDNGTIVSFSTITSTTGIAIYTQYYVINATADTFQLSATSGGAAIALTTNGSGNMLYPAYITAITTNSSFQMSAPASATGSVTLTARILNTFPAASKGWTVTG
jgi:surface protein